MTSIPVSYCVGCISIATVIAILLSVSEAKSLMENEIQNAGHHIVKRNTWWSKKSMDDVDRLGLDTPSHYQESPCNEIKEALGCYTTECVSDFIWCAQESDSRQQYLQCQLRHKLCLGRCLGESSENTLAALLS